MKICIVGWPTDTDGDIKRSCKDNGIDVRWLMLGPVNPYSVNYMGDDYTLPTSEQIKSVIRDSTIDFFIYKYPFWLEQYPELKALIGKRPVVAWQTEHGPTLRYALQASNSFQYVAVTNRYEMKAYASALPGKKILYFPFGCVDWTDKELHSVPKYETTLVADGTPHYTCGCEGGDKRVSCEVMLSKVHDYDFACYGYLGHLGMDHEWPSTPWAYRHRGTYECWEYPQVYSSAKAYLGITFNWRTGAIGVKCVRAMSTGIPVIWHKTVGMEEEGLLPVKHFLAPSSAEETKEMIEYVLKKPITAKNMGNRAKNFVVNNFEYVKLIRDLANQL